MPDPSRTSVIASILADNVPGVLRRARLAAMAGADWLEVRLDRLPADVEPRAILGEVRLPVLVACRTARDGGTYAGSHEARRALLQAWVDAGVAGIDLEAWETWVPTKADSLRVRMRSYHNLTRVDENLPAIRDELLKMGASVAKIAVTAHDLTAAAPVLDLMASSDQAKTPTVAFAMGEDAWPTRILACVYGAPFVYGSSGRGLETAPGQLPVEILTGLLDVHRFTGSTQIYGVLGNPARDSWGPWLFNRAFRRLSHDGIYLPFTTAHPEAAVRMLSRRRLRGLSVTAPHKAAFLRHCHDLDEEVSTTGALNTLVFRAHGAVAGHNTDVLGVQRALTDAGLDAPGANAVVLGGGGAARAAALALAKMGLKPVLMPRSLESVREFSKAQGFPLARLDASVLQDLHPKCVVHATPVGGPRGGPRGGPLDRPPGGPLGRLGDARGPGANGRDGAQLLLPDWKIAPGTYVLDMVYQHGETPLLRATREASGIPVPGLAMFLAQAQEQLYLFTGRRLPRAVLAELVGIEPAAARLPGAQPPGAQPPGTAPPTLPPGTPPSGTSPPGTPPPGAQPQGGQPSGAPTPGDT